MNSITDMWIINQKIYIFIIFEKVLPTVQFKFFPRASSIIKIKNKQDLNMDKLAEMKSHTLPIALSHLSRDDLEIMVYWISSSMVGTIWSLGKSLKYKKATELLTKLIPGKEWSWVSIHIYLLPTSYSSIVKAFNTAFCLLTAGSFIEKYFWSTMFCSSNILYYGLQLCS